MYEGGFYFISNILELDLKVPIKISKGLRLEKAKEEQIKLIQKSLEENTGFIKTARRSLYEYSTNIEKSKKQFSHRLLKKSEWKYYILSYSGNNYEACKFFKIANLIPPYFQSVYDYHTSKKFGKGEVLAHGWDPLANSSFYLHPNREAHKLDLNTLNFIIDLHKQYSIFDKQKYEGIERAINLNSTLNQINQTSSLYILGLFMIIKMLITHKPNDKEIGDSLNHQIKTKIPFLSRRFYKPLDYSCFESSAPEKIWSSLYHFRSCIAHGSHVDFSKSPLKILKSNDTATEFLRFATKTLLVQAITEPEFINGLKPI